MIGIFLPPDSFDVSKIKYSLKLISIFDKEKYINKVIIFVYKRDTELLKQHTKYLPIKIFNFNIFRKIIQRLKKKFNLKYVPTFNVAINKYGITFGIFPTPPADINKCQIHYAASFQSLGHRLNPELIETAGNGLWLTREDSYRTICNNASLILIDSDTGKEYLDFYYKPKAEIIVIPHTLPDILNINIDAQTQKSVLNKFSVSKPFLFYPAQLWPHKNHVRILEAIRYLKNKGIDIQLVFTSSSKSIRKEYGIEYILRRIAKDANIDNNLVITGFLENEEIKTFYKNALAMIMPQLIPEPCIPYVEAMAIGCPVIGSDIPGIREQINGSGVLVNPYNVTSIADGIETLLNEDIRDEYIKKGLSNYKDILIKYNKAFVNIEEIICKYEQY